MQKSLDKQYHPIVGVGKDILEKARYNLNKFVSKRVR